MFKTANKKYVKLPLIPHQLLYWLSFFFCLLHFTVYSSQEWCLKVKVEKFILTSQPVLLFQAVQSKLQFYFQFVSCGKDVECHFFFSVLWCEIDMCCHASERFEERKQLISKPDLSIYYLPTWKSQGKNGKLQDISVLQKCWKFNTLITRILWFPPS